MPGKTRERLLRYRRQGLSDAFERNLTHLDAASEANVSVQYAARAYRDIVRLSKANPRNPYFPGSRESRKMSQRVIAEFVRGTSVPEAARRLRLSENRSSKDFAL